MREHYVDRLENLLQGEHLHHWKVRGPAPLMLASNDYLAIGDERALRAAQASALWQAETNLLMSSVMVPEDGIQARLERRLAAFMDAQDGVLAQSGWSANVGLLQTIARPDVPVYLDQMAHASLWEGVHAAGARAVPFRHNDADHLERQLRKHGGPGVIAVDSLYSTNGAIAPLADVADLAERHDCVLVVDESHSLGTHGPAGAGLVPALGLCDRVHFRTASLAKAFAGRAGFITCSHHFKGYFLSESRPAIFSSCLLSHEIAWLQSALHFIAGADGRRARLHQVARQVRSGLRDLGYCLDGSEQIIALEAGTEPRTLILRKALERRGIAGAVFCAPATAKNRALVRLSLHSGLQDNDVARLLEACADMREEVDLQGWSSTCRHQAATLRLAQ
jgi:CAI-1 autoinducer synthase